MCDSQYGGVFLPGFQAVEDGPEPELVTGLDHLTYVVRPGQTAAILAWYKHCCGMQRFNLSPQVGSLQCSLL